MKGITIIIILSVVWSIVAGIIEKRKAAAKKAGVTPQSQRSFKADPVTVKVESLRRRQKTQQKVQPPQAVTQPPRTVIKKKSIQSVSLQARAHADSVRLQAGGPARYILAAIPNHRPSI